MLNASANYQIANIVIMIFSWLKLNREFFIFEVNTICFLWEKLEEKPLTFLDNKTTEFHLEIFLNPTSCSVHHLLFSQEEI